MKGSGLNSNDFLTDPLYDDGQFCKFAELKEPEQSNWEVFHWSTRSKLEASIYFYSQTVGLGSVRHVWFTLVDFDTLLNWHVDAFFNELVSAFDTLLQEINVVYRCGLKPDKVTWEGKRGIKGCLSGKAGRMCEIIAGAYDNETFKDIRRWRNIAAHRHHIPRHVSFSPGWGELIRKGSTEELITALHKPGDNVDVSELSKHINFIRSLATEIWQRFPRERAGGK